jgi:hypothetical protein
MNNKVIELSKLLQKLHKSLLHFQSSQHQEKIGKKLGPYEILNLSINDPEFAWLRKLSELIVAIDIQEEENPQMSDVDFSKIKNEASGLLFGDGEKYQDFKSRLQVALSQDPELNIYHAELITILKL